MLCLRKTMAVILGMVLAVAAMPILPSIAGENIAIDTIDLNDTVTDTTAHTSYADDSVVIVLDRSYGAVNKTWSSGDFEELNIEHIEDLTITDNEIHYELLSSNDEFYQILELDLANIDEMDVEEAIEVLEQDDRVLAVSPNYHYELLYSPNDPAYKIPTNTYSDGVKELYQNIGAENAWDITLGSSEVTVGIMDSGIAYHEDLNNVADGYTSTTVDARTDTDNHGTPVAGIIGATHNNGKASAGIAPLTTLIPLQVTDNNAKVTTTTLTKAIVYATLHQIDIVNCSVGASEYDSILYNAMKMYSGLIVCAAGNAGVSNEDDEGNVADNAYYPASFDLDNIISVAAVDENDRLLDRTTADGEDCESNYGKTTVDLAAPGFMIPTTSADSHDYVMESRTSIATPFVSGTAALLLAYNPNLTPKELKTIIMDSVDKNESLTDKVASGGRLNIYKALQNTLAGDYIRNVTTKISVETEDSVGYLQMMIRYNTERYDLHSVTFDESIVANALYDYSVDGEIAIFVLPDGDTIWPQDFVKCNFSTRQKFALTNDDITMETVYVKNTNNQNIEVVAGIMNALLGDVDGNNDINTSDSRRMYQYVSGVATATEQEMLAMDVNCDGAINMVDVSVQMNYVNGSLVSFL